jgi:hypothetical protein
MKNAWLKIAPIVTLAFFSCTYDPDQEYFKEIDQTPPTGIILLDQYNEKDTIFLYQPSNFEFKVAVSRGEVKEVEVLLNDLQLLSNLGSAGSFSISSNNLKTGTYELKIQFISNSGTGSLADKAGAESYQVWRKWIIKIDVDLPPQPQLTLSQEKGFLKLNWDRYDKVNFVDYTLTVGSSNSYRTFVFHDPSKTFWVDSSFLGISQVAYTISVSNIIGRTVSEYKYVKNEQDFAITYDPEDTMATLTWRRPAFPSAFKDIVITENNTVRTTITSALDTTYNLRLNVLFGQQAWVEIQMNPKDPEYGPYSEKLLIQNPLGLKKLADNPVLSYNAGMNAVVGYKDLHARLCIYNSEMNSIDSIGSIPNPHVPYSGKYIYYGQGPDVVQLDLQTRETKRLTTTSTYLGLTGIVGSSNQLVSYGYIDKSVPWDQRYINGIYDFNSRSFVQQGNAPYNPHGYYYNAHLSDDGQFAWVRNPTSIHRVLPNGLQLIDYLSQTGSFHSFRPDNNQEIFLRDFGGRMIVLNTNDLSVLKTISLPAGYQLRNYDPVSKNFLCVKDEGTQVHMINVDTEEIKTINAYSSGFTLLNGFLFCSDGTYLKVL